jgi:Na+-driven multidrug efflux pump
VAQVPVKTDPQVRNPSMVSSTVRHASAVLLGLVAGLVLQAWTLGFLGHLGGEALYIRAIYTPVSFLVLAVTEGLSIASQVSAGIATRNKRADALWAFPTLLSLGGGCLLLIGALFMLGQNVVFGVLNVSPANRDGVVTFVISMCLASVVSLAPILGSALLRGTGRTGSASILAVGATVLSVLAMIVLDNTTELGVLVVPVGILAADIVLGAAAMVLLRGQLARISRLRPRRDALGELWKFGAPVTGTFLMLSVVSSGYLAVLRNAGETGIAGFSLGQMAIGYFMSVAMAIGSGAAITANLIPGEPRKPIIQAGLAVAVRTALPAYAVLGALAYLLRHPLAGLLSSDEAIAAAGAEYFMWIGPTLTVYGATLAILSYLEQVGRGSAAFVLNVIYFAAMLAIAFSLPQPVSSLTMTKLLAITNVIGFATCWTSAWYLVRRSRE